MAVQRVVSGVEIKNDLFGRTRVRLEEEGDLLTLDRRPVMADLVIARGDFARQFEPV